MSNTRAITPNLGVVSFMLLILKGKLEERPAGRL